MRHTQPKTRVSDYKFPKRSYVVWWMEFMALFAIAICATIVRALKESESAARLQARAGSGIV